ncbi:two-component sensor histidine kinase [Micromonospora endophytica]|uniref:histidine kinase n=1 Tax=Micromonospora endophytica TaxID=515350 RepID=A0A2W2CAQ4_9ACTN|nr:HAMP domain-containing sensor histidine kinase [Micromonospora endophytica]PZF89954.1 two-component sensor histidine kinase [Micromonospora endophytica]RIW42663.1 sensor histidine kinase [Micromonospora endophytica]
MRRRRVVPRRWRHWTLRSRLVVVVAVLAVVALLIANAAGLVLLRSYLVDRVDRQLTRMVQAAVNRPPVEPAAESARSDRPPPGTGPGQMVVTYHPNGTASTMELFPTDLSPPALTDYADLVQRAGTPFTVDARDGDSRWRILVEPADDGGLAVVGSTLRDIDATADGLLLIDGVVMTLVVLALSLTAAVVVRIGLRPLTEMETISAEITAGDLSRRVADTDPHTEPGRLGAALNTMLDRIGAEMAARSTSEQRLRQFVADASHELRTPLTSIRGFAELYRRGGTPPGPVLDEAMSRIEREAARMGLLVDDLLLLARLDAQRPIRRQPVDLLAIAADTIRDAYARMPDRPVRLETYGSDDAESFDPVQVQGDEHRLRQVATNLVANALLHTPPGTDITVRVGRLADAGESQQAVLEVADNGPGIPAEHVPRIFERLYRVEASRTRSNGVGSGLGLAIVAAIVQRHGGRVEVTTTVGQGSTFRVLLPTGSPPQPG